MQENVRIEKRKDSIFTGDYEVNGWTFKMKMYREM